MQLPTGASRFILSSPIPPAMSGPRHYTPYFHDNGLDCTMVPLAIAPRTF